MILADTNVVSEFMRRSMDPTVASWAATVPPAELVISAVTVQEIEYGIARLRAGRRRDALAEAWASLLGEFVGSVVAYDTPAAQHTASILAAAESSGHRMSVLDGQLAGTCLAGNLVLATRNTKDFATVSGLGLINPWALAADR